MAFPVKDFMCTGVHAALKPAHTVSVSINSAVTDAVPCITSYTIKVASSLSASGRWSYHDALSVAQGRRQCRTLVYRWPVFPLEACLVCICGHEVYSLTVSDIIPHTQISPYSLNDFMIAIRSDVCSFALKLSFCCCCCPSVSPSVLKEKHLPDLFLSVYFASFVASVHTC